MKKERPVNLNLATIHFPVTAIISIIHRMSGILLFLFIPFLLWVTEYSLSSQQNFMQLQACMANFWLRLIVWVFVSALLYHLIAGIRHLLMDIHVGETLEGGRFGAWLVLAISIVLIVAIGCYLLCNINHSIW